MSLMHVSMLLLLLLLLLVVVVVVVVVVAHVDLNSDNIQCVPPPRKK